MQIGDFFVHPEHNMKGEVIDITSQYALICGRINRRTV